jgi:hypothetical protein
MEWRDGDVDMWIAKRHASPARALLVRSGLTLQPSRPVHDATEALGTGSYYRFSVDNYLTNPRDDGIDCCSN